MDVEKRENDESRSEKSLQVEEQRYFSDKLGKALANAAMLLKKPPAA